MGLITQDTNLIRSYILNTSKYFLTFIMLIMMQSLKAETFSIGTYIINMGVVPQTISNGMKPYGLVYEMLNTYRVPVKWVIRSTKQKDSADFIYNGTSYKGGTFIIPKEFITSNVLSRLTYWRGQGVVMDTTISSLTVDVTHTLTSAPRWTISSVNSSLATSMFTHASIPASAYNFNTPSSLGYCDDIFALPHADPTWALHSNLYTWNRTYRGAIWASCHAISVLENLANPSNSSQRMNFLSNNGLIPYGSHANGSTPFSYYFNRGSYNGLPISANAADPVFQMMGIEDGAHTNGSEQVYIPVSGSGSGWRNTTKIGCYDSTQSNVSAFPNGPAAITLYGRGFGVDTFGYVMYQSGHNITGTAAANVAAMRQFFNFSLITMKDKVPTLNSSSIPTSLSSNNSHSFSVSASSPMGLNLRYQWSSSCGGTFSSPNSASTNFTSGIISSDTTCTITCLITDTCSRITFISTPVQILTSLPLKLINFDAELQNSAVKLNWTSTAEENVFIYQVERSDDGKSFYPIQDIQAIGNKHYLNDYSHLDKNISLKNKTIYYRLKMIDKDAYFTYSPIVDVVLNSNEASIVSLIPNPVSDILFIELNMPFSTFAQYEITDLYGRVIYSSNEAELINSNTVKLDTKILTNGVYIITFRKNSGSSASAKFVKY